MIVCLCEGVSDRTVEACVAEGARSVKEIGRRCGAGTGCGMCVRDLADAVKASSRAPSRPVRSVLAK